MNDAEKVEHTFKQFRELDETYKPDLDKIDEAFVQKLWNEQRFFDTNMQAIDRRTIRVLKPGIWNHNEGPDFMHAEIEIDGKLQIGDVEIHVQSSEWYDHKHHLNSRYNRVILHAVYFDDDINLRTRLQNGKRIPTLEFLKWVNADIGDLYNNAQEAASEDGICRVTGKPLNMEVLKGVFESLGRERFLEKVESMRLLRTRLEFEQLLYEGIMEALGYARNNKAMRELAQHVPFTDLDEKSELEIQATLFGVAGLLPSQREKPLPIEVTSDPSIVALEKSWYASEYAELPQRMTDARWSFTSRPVNHPVRRIAAVGQLIHRCQGSLMMYFLPTCEKTIHLEGPRSLQKIGKELRTLLTLEPTGYWETHFSFGINNPRKEALIGNARAVDIIVNKILPVIYIWAVEAESQKLQDAILRLYSASPKSTGNKIISQINEQIFTETQQLRHLKPTAKIEQGVIRLYKNYCADWLCDLCPILEHDAVLSEES
ncbi:DUF2851 family protein [Candidatus Poribacteria bacterium]|nr:DUF2851 family protein [Candidatus Poribacteria bacterium]MYK18690.1 DUF2851 family protein [Candidatus Poribacteria bacterium]